MSLSSIPFDPTLFMATVTTAAVMYQTGVMGAQFQSSTRAPIQMNNTSVTPPEAIGFRRANAFQESLAQRPRFTTRNAYLFS